MILEVVREHAVRTPDGPAVITPTDSLTWRELARQVDLRAAALPDPSGASAQLVALHQPSDAQWVIDMLVLWTRGYAMLALPDALPPSAAADLATSLGALAILNASVGGWQMGHAGACRHVEGRLVHLTSGTTGRAKGVLRSASNLEDEAAAVAEALEFSDHRPVLMSTPVSHSFASGLLLAALMAGAPSVLMPRFDPRSLIQLATRWQPGTIAGTPYLFRMLTGAKAIRREGLPGLRFPMSGGAPLPPAWAQAWAEVAGVPICQEYGLSEGGIATVNRHRAADAPESVGAPIPRVRVQVVDTAGRPAQVGSEGRVVVDRPHNPDSYVGADGWSGPVPRSTGPGVRGVETGDLGRLDGHGMLTLTGRTKLMINVAGAKVSPFEVEQRLLDSPLVHDAVVTGVVDENRGEVVGALVHPTPGATIAALTDHLRDRLSTYAIPRQWAFTDSIPRTASGKPDRRRAKLILGS